MSDFSRPILFALLLFSSLLVPGVIPHAQTTIIIRLNNPSFEDTPGPGRPALGWYFCGPAGETPPDIHPVASFGVSQPPADGRTYAGLVVRDNGTWEALGQKLSQPMRKGACYLLRLSTSRSKTYFSFSRSTSQPAGFIQPALLRIWGDDQHCGHKELLAVSKPVVWTEWDETDLLLKPEQDLDHLVIEAYYDTENNPPYNGNVLIDHIFPLLPVNCNSGEPLVPLTALPAIPPDISLSSLRETIRSSGSRIQFSADDLTPMQDWFLVNSLRPVAGNMALWQIARETAAIPGTRLLIALNEQSQANLHPKASQVAKELQAAGLHPDRFLIRRKKRADRKKTWDFAREDLLIRVE